MNDIKANFPTLLWILFLSCKLTDLQAQVNVHEEPRHHPVFQNDQIRILNVVLPPGDTTQYHIHHTPSVFIFFTKTSIVAQLQGAEPLSSRSVAGNIIVENLAPPHLRVHRVWNADKDTFHVMDVELLSKDTGFLQKPLSLPGLETVVDTTWVRVYKISLQKRMDIILNNEKHSLLLVSLATGLVQTKENGKTQKRGLLAGSFFEIRQGRSFSLKNIGNSTAQFALLEMPH